MNFTRRSELDGQHAFLSPSNNSWTNYDDDKLIEVYQNRKAVELGTKLHKYAADAILLNRTQPRNKETVNQYINDAIMMKMTPELPLFYSYSCFGTTDAISYRRNVLRIHDLKTGKTEAGMKQLYIYAALFCLDYQSQVRELRKSGKSDVEIADRFDLKPDELHFDPERFGDIVLRIYQFNDFKEDHPDPAEIRDLMDLIEHDVLVLRQQKEEE